MFFIGADLGQRKDPTAIAVVERREPVVQRFDHLHWLHTSTPLPDEWIVRFLERVPLGTPYTAVVDRLHSIASHPQLHSNSWMVVDATGLGAPVVDMLRARPLPCHLMPVVLTSGVEERFDGRVWRVPKIDLLARLQMLFEQRRLRIARAAKNAGILVRELADIRGRQMSHGHLRIGADAHGQHDDLVMAVALAVWTGRRQKMGPQGRVGWVPHRVV